MKILLCASVTPDTTAKINFTADKKSLEQANVTFILNPYDDHALASAMNIKEANNAYLTVVHVGDKSAEPILRKVLAVGADEAILINATPYNAQYVAQLIAEIVKQNQYDLIITGRESIDFNGAELCDLLAEYVGIPSIAYVSHIDITPDTIKLKRFIDGGEQNLELANTPIVISATKELAEPKIPNMRGIMSAKSKPLTVLEPTNLINMVELVEFEAPIAKSGVKLIEAENAGQLIDILHNDIKII
ncbi:MAG: electron transfer flavoprotein subunit beta/FixA family protein [Bacteroidota bacterium]|nr:electron transfer flavoprotein subunit beta/FixA family protein [Bacteroidota bacterium]